jgi:hypothetical protein
MVTGVGGVDVSGEGLRGGVVQLCGTHPFLTGQREICQRGV